MPRRMAIAAALALTIVVTFAVVSLGAQAGWFSPEKTATSQAARVDPPPTEAAPPATEAPPPPTPVVITRYEYVDEPAPKAADPAPPAPTSAPPPAPTIAPVQQVQSARPVETQTEAGGGSVPALGGAHIVVSSASGLASTGSFSGGGEHEGGTGAVGEHAGGGSTGGHDD